MRSAFLDTLKCEINFKIEIKTKRKLKIEKKLGS